MKVKQALAMQSIRNLAAEIDGEWEPERKPLPVDPPGKLATAGRIAAFVAAAVMLSTVLLFGLVGCNSRQPCCCESRPTCPKSSGVCDCRYCACPPTCPGQCAADTIMRAGGVITMYADPVAKECGEYGVFARVEANGKDDEPRTVAISMKDTACEAFADAARQMKLAAQPCCEVGK